MKNTSLILAIVVVLASFGQVTTDLYLPSLPAMAHSLATDYNTIQTSIVIYMLGFSLSQLVYGPVSDALGRRFPLINGFIICLIGGVFCVTAQAIPQLLLGRLLQGIGAGAATTFSRAIFRDCFSGIELARYGSYLAMANIFILSSAPVLGGYIQSHLGWHANFLFLLFYNVSLLLLVYFKLPETSEHHHRDNLKAEIWLKNFKSLVCSRVFLTYNLCIFTAYASLVAWITVSPILMQTVLGMTPQRYGLLCMLGGSGFLLGAVLNALWVKRYGSRTMLRVGLVAELLAGGLTLLAGFLGYLTITTVIIPIIFLLFAAGLIFPNAFAGAFTPFAHIAGTAAALSGSLQILGGMVSSSLMALSHDKTQLPMGWIFFCGAVVALFCETRLVKSPL